MISKFAPAFSLEVRRVCEDRTPKAPCGDEEERQDRRLCIGRGEEDDGARRAWLRGRLGSRDPSARCSVHRATSGPPVKARGPRRRAGVLLFAQAPAEQRCVLRELGVSAALLHFRCDLRHGDAAWRRGGVPCARPPLSHQCSLADGHRSLLTRGARNGMRFTSGLRSIPRTRPSASSPSSR